MGWPGVQRKSNSFALPLFAWCIKVSHLVGNYLPARMLPGPNLRKSVHRFANDQIKRMTGQKGRGKKGQRPEIEAKFGYDVKAAMHTLRLLYECKELLSEGRITLPRPERKLLIRVRTEKYSIEKVLEMANKLFSQCDQAIANSELPERVNRAAVSKLIAESYLKAWATPESRDA
jgi:uncharacterized protein